MKKNFLLCLVCLASLTGYSQTFNSTTGTVPDNSCGPTNNFSILVSGVGILGGTNMFGQIELNITMKHDGDLDISLISPDGKTIVPLSLGEGGAGSDFTHTIFKADATKTLSQGTAPFTGDFYPDGDLNAFNAVQANGTWTLRICDTGAGDIANLDNAALTFVTTVPVTCAAPTNVFSSAITASSAHLSWTAGGSANFFYVLDSNPANPTVAGTATTATTYDATLLMPEMNYYFHVRNDCEAANGLSTWSKATFTTPPANDDCAHAVKISSLPYTNGQNILGATNAGGFIAACGDGMNDGAWYSFTVETAGSLTVSVTPDLSWNPEVAIYTGSCGTFTCTGAADSGAKGAAESLTLASLAPGQYWINVGDGSGTVDNLEGSFAISVTGTAMLGVLGTESFDKANFSYYPNPVKNKLNLSYIKNISNVTVFNMLGQQVMSKMFNSNASQVDMSGLSSGTYFVKVTADNQAETFKVIKE